MLLVLCLIPLQDPSKLHYGCGVATAAQVDKLSSGLAALEPRVAAAAAQASSSQATLAQGQNQTAELSAGVNALRAAVAALAAQVASVQQQQLAGAANTSDITQKIAALSATRAQTAQQLASLAAANQTVAQGIAEVKAASQQCTCGAELAVVNATTAAVQSAQAAGVAAISSVNATAESAKAAVATGSAAIASVNASIATLAANLPTINVTGLVTLSALSSIDAATLNGVPAAQYLRARIVLYSASSTTTFTANLGGRSGADAKCVAPTSTGQPAGLVRVRAFLSVSATDQIADFPTLYGVPTGLPIQTASGQVLASNFSTLLRGSIPVSLDAAGVLPFASTWWTGSNADGSVSTATGLANTCIGWTDAGSNPNGQAGRSGTTGSAWISFSALPCGLQVYVLCLAF
jgi:hypothetical protein